MTPLELAETYDVPTFLAEKAKERLSSGKVGLIGVSGKIASGKDTISPLIMEKLGLHNNAQLAFADDLKREMTHIINLINSSENLDNAQHSVLSELQPSKGPFQDVVSLLYPLVKEREILDGYSRHPQFRTAIQWWGTNVRRAEDEQYWVKKLVANTLKTVSEGTSVYVTDGRFPNEVKSIEDMGGTLVRLNISREVQLQRIIARDGKAPDLKNLAHASETALDDYGFPIVLSVDSKTPPDIAKEAAELIA